MKKKILMLALAVMAVFAFVPGPGPAGADVLTNRFINLDGPGGREYHPKLEIKWDTNFVFGQLKFDGTDIVNLGADKIQVQWINLERRAWNSTGAYSVVEICDQTSDPDNNDGMGCEEGEEGTNGPCKIFNDIYSAHYAEPGCDQGATDRVQTGKKADTCACSFDYKVVIKWHIKWDNGVETGWRTDQLILDN